MSTIARPSVTDIEQQIALAREWMADDPTDYDRARYGAVIEALRWVRSGGRGPVSGDDYDVIDDHALHTESYVAHAAEQMALNTGEDSVRPGCVHEALEYVLGRGEAPVED